MAVVDVKPRKKKSSSGPPSFPTAGLDDLQGILIFREIPKKILGMLEGRVRRATAEEGETILELAEENNLFNYFFFILRGQVKIVGYDEEARPRSLNFLRKGEFFVDKRFSWGGQTATKVVAITDTELLMLGRDDLKELASKYPSFDERLEALTERIDYRNRVYSQDSYARSILDFLIDTELTQASRVKITQLDKCIECNTCYTSCEERHGFQRLSRGYARFGTLDFAHSCLTCFYPTCIPACPVDSVLYNPNKGEVEILDSCIGCSACARACQYGAIRMHKVEAEDTRFGRFMAPDKKIKPKFVADKCNHCNGYEDMVCISNCPTGAIIEVEATALLENPRIFGSGEGVHKPLPSRTKMSWMAMLLQKTYIVFGLLSSFWLFWECFAMNRWPGLSMLVRLQSTGLIPADFEIAFRRGSDFCIFLGNLGFTFIVAGMTYPLYKSFPGLFKYLGKKPTWLDFHNFCGMMGMVLILLHTGFELPIAKSPFSTLGFGALFLVMLSGIFGRFLYQVIPRGVAGTELRMRDIQEEDAAITQKLDALFENSKSYQALVTRILNSLTKEASKKATLWNLAKSVVMTRILIWRIQFHPPTEVRGQVRQIGIFVELLHEKIRLQRNAAFLDFSSRLFIRWQYIHKPFAYLMAFFAIGHTIYNFLFFKWH